MDFGPDRQRFAYPPQEFHHGGGHWALWIVPFLILLLMAATFVWVVVQTRGGRWQARPLQTGDAAVDELRLRYARGEVTREDFLAAEADLRGATPAGD